MERAWGSAAGGTDNYMEQSSQTTLDFMGEREVKPWSGMGLCDTPQNLEVRSSEQHKTSGSPLQGCVSGGLGLPQSKLSG